MWSRGVGEPTVPFNPPSLSSLRSHACIVFTWRAKRAIREGGKEGTVGSLLEGVVGGTVGSPTWTNQCTCKNSDMKLTLYVAEDMWSYLDISGLPENVVFGGTIPEMYVV